MNINRKVLYNPSGDDSDKRVVGGQPTNVFDLYNIKYKWAQDIFSTMLSNHWVPEKSSMVEDKLSYTKLDEHEKESFLKILSFLIFLDSIQTNNVPNIAEYITAPEIVLCLSRQTFDEALHSKSYGWILTSIFDRETAEKAIYYWREDKILRTRNEYIANIYQQFLEGDTKDLKSLVRVMVANYLLEGLYFYNGFYFFYNLGSRGLMTDTVTQIKYINRDELQHCLLFRNILVTMFKENPGLQEECQEMVYEMVRIAVQQEIEFSNHVIGDRILGMNKQSIHDYTHYLANKRLVSLGYEPVMEKTKNPYKHLETLASVENETTAKTNIFEKQSIAYKQATILGGWDEI